MRPRFLVPADGFAEMLQRFTRISLAQPHLAEAVMTLRVGGIERQSPKEVVTSFVMTSLKQQIIPTL